MNGQGGKVSRFPTTFTRLERYCGYHGKAGRRCACALTHQTCSKATCEHTDLIRKSDYVYCETCEMFVDLWRYDWSLRDAGHLGHKTREPTDEEFRECVGDCARSGCFDE